MKHTEDYRHAYRVCWVCSGTP